MAIVTKYRDCIKEQSVADFSGSNRGNGNDRHGLIGLASGTVFRGLYRFEAIPWSNWNAHRIVDAWIEFSNSDHNGLDTGSAGGLVGRRASTAWTENGGAEDSWTVSATTVYPGPSVAGATMTDASIPTTGDFRFNVKEYVEAIAPASVLQSDGTTPGGAETDRGVRVISNDEGDADNLVVVHSRRSTSKGKRPRLAIRFDDNARPGAVTVQTPTPTGSYGAAATQHASTDGRTLTVRWYFNDADGGVPEKVELEVFADSLTDGTVDPATARYTTGPTTAFRSVGAGWYTVALGGLPARTTQRFRIKAMDFGGLWGPWTSLSNGRITTAYLPGAPRQRSMTTDPDNAYILGTINSADTGDYVRRWEGRFFRDNPDGSVTPLGQWDVDLGDSSSLRRPSIEYTGKPLKDGDQVRHSERHQNRDLVQGPWSTDMTTVMRAQVGPTVTPSDTGTKLTARTGPVTIANASFDGYAIRLFRGETQVYPPGGIDKIESVSATTSTAASLPADVVGWGDTLGIQAATRPAGTSVLGDWSPRSEIYVNSLPTTTLTASDGDGSTSDVIPTLDVEWSLPYEDVDVANYSEQPTRQEVEIRVAASPVGSGALVTRRLNTYPDTPQLMRTGRTLDDLQVSTGWTTDANVTVAAYVTTNATGYSGNNTNVVPTGGGSVDRGAKKTVVTGAQDLSVFGNQAYIRIQRRCTSVTNLVRFNLRFEFASASDYAEFEIFGAAEAINTWDEAAVLMGNPVATSGTVDWSLFSGVIYVWADLSGAYAGQIQIRDLRIGITQTDKDTPDGYLAPDVAYDVRGRYADDADPKATTAVAATLSAGATNLKVDAVTGIEVGDWIMTESVSTPGLYAQAREVTAVGSAGAGGSGITVSEEFTFGAVVGWPVRVLHWGAWTPWITRTVSLPPTVTASTPADAATVTDPTQSLVFTFSSPGGKDQASHTVRVYDEDGALIYERTTEDDAVTDVLPTLLLEDDTEYQWEIEAFDTDGLSGTTARRTFTTDFTVPDPVDSVTATADDETGAVTIDWVDSVVASDFDHYRVYWVDSQTGQDVRIDGGPAEVDDGNTKLTDLTFTWYGGRLGTNTFRVTSHNGSQESEALSVDEDLGPPTDGLGEWVINDDGGTILRVWAQEVPRTHTGVVETLTPPGRPYPVVHHWGRSGRKASVTYRFRPGEEGDQLSPVRELHHSGDPFWIKAPQEAAWDVMRVRCVALEDETESWSWVSVTMELVEVARS